MNVRDTSHFRSGLLFFSSLKVVMSVCPTAGVPLGERRLSVV